MRHHAKGSAALLLASMWVGATACDAATEAEPTASTKAQGSANVVARDDAKLEAEAKVEVEGDADANANLEADVSIEPAAFDLEAVVGVVEAGELESAAELEVIVNDQERGYNRIDIDGDGTIDHVQVVEVELETEAEVEAEASADVLIELRAIPSSKASADASVTFAVFSFARHQDDATVDIEASYTSVVHEPQVRVYTRTVPVKAEAGVVISGSLFLSWVYATERPMYVGSYEVDERGHWIPPGHVKHGHWKATGDADLHGDVRGHHEASSDRAHGKGDGSVVVKVKSTGKGSSKIQIGGSSKSSAKASAKASSKSSSKSSAKASSSKGGKSKGGKGKGK